MIGLLDMVPSIYLLSPLPRLARSGAWVKKYFSIFVGVCNKITGNVAHQHSEIAVAVFYLLLLNAFPFVYFCVQVFPRLVLAPSCLVRSRLHMSVGDCICVTCLLRRKNVKSREPEWEIFMKFSTRHGCQLFFLTCLNV